MMIPELVCLTFEFSKHFNVKFMSLLRREMFYFITTPISFLLDRTALSCSVLPLRHQIYFYRSNKEITLTGKLFYVNTAHRK